MSGYEYGNARLKAMKSFLLSRSDLEAFAEADSVQRLISLLTKTVYRKPVEAALARSSGLGCIQQALHEDLISTLGKIRTFFAEDAAQSEVGAAVAIVLQQYDLHNLKAILRGQANNATSAEMLATLLPVGELSISILTELTRAPGPRGVIDLLASMNLSYAQPLLNLRGRRPGADVFEMELVLEQWYHQTARAKVKEMTGEVDWLSAWLDLEADLTNLLTVLRFVHEGQERPQLQQALRDRFGSDTLEVLWVSPGRLSAEQLALLAAAASIETLVEGMHGLPYYPAMAAGLGDYLKGDLGSGRLSVFERELRAYRLRWMKTLLVKDPLGIGVLLGFLALKVSEVRNLRWVALGIHLGLSAANIRAELEGV